MDGSMTEREALKALGWVVAGMVVMIASAFCGVPWGGFVFFIGFFALLRGFFKCV